MGKERGSFDAALSGQHLCASVVGFGFRQMYGSAKSTIKFRCTEWYAVGIFLSARDCQRDCVFGGCCCWLIRHQRRSRCISFCLQISAHKRQNHLFTDNFVTWCQSAKKVVADVRRDTSIFSELWYAAPPSRWCFPEEKANFISPWLPFLAS